MSLWSLFLQNNDRVAFKWTHYFPAYERHFSRYRNRPVVFWEIGCFKGGSLQMWKRWLGPQAQIVGIDIDPECASFEEPQIAIRIGNQSDTAFLQSVLDEFGAPDVILDDGSHIMSDVTASFQYLYERMDRAGVYLVEDMHTSYWEEYEGGLRRPGTFMEAVKDMIDILNATHSRGALAPTSFTQTTDSIHIYDSIVCFERAPRLPSYSLATGKEQT